MLKAGGSAPSFTLVDHNGDMFDSEAIAGWYLLYWYPKANTPGCTAQAKGLRDQLDSFVDLGCEVLGASFDEPSSNAEFRSEHNLRFSLLSDSDHRSALAFGAIDRIEQSNPNRVAYLVDPDRTIRAVYEVVDPEFFAETVLDDLEALLEGRS